MKTKVPKTTGTVSDMKSDENARPPMNPPAMAAAKTIKTKAVCTWS